jgi:CRP/FNR family cyclic AMP-dependent transcriptional regulator
MSDSFTSCLPFSESGFAPREPHPCMKGLPAVQGYASGTQLCKQGGPPPEAYLVVSGLVKLAAIGADGQETLVGIRPAGRVIGLASVLLQRPHVVSATTVGTCELRRVPSGILTDRMADDPVLSRYVHEELSRENYDQAAQLLRLRTMPARDRLIEALFQIAGASAPDAPRAQRRIPPLLKQWEIAQLAGVTPQHLSVLLKKLEGEGLIRREKSWLLLSAGAAGASGHPAANI